MREDVKREGDPDPIAKSHITFHVSRHIPTPQSSRDLHSSEYEDPAPANDRILDGFSSTFLAVFDAGH